MRLLFTAIMVLSVLYSFKKAPRQFYWTDKRLKEDVNFLGTLEASTGNVFSGDKTRAFPRAHIQFKNVSFGEIKPRLIPSECKKWGVLTTINAPSEALRRFMYQKEWCVVVVLDKNSDEKVN